MCQRNTSLLGFQRVGFTKVKSPWKFFFMTDKLIRFFIKLIRISIPPVGLRRDYSLLDMRRKSGFLFAFLSFICNFADDNQI